jgi:hypothetical protein
MALTCPCCRATNETADCRRCKADLSLLAAVEKRREYHLRIARRYAADLKTQDALSHVQSANQLRPGTDTQQLLAALLLLSGQPERALQAYDGTV